MNPPIIAALDPRFSAGSYTEGLNVHIQDDSILDITGGLTIEDNVDISLGCLIYTHAHAFHQANWRNLPKQATPLIIRTGVFIGAKSIIIPGVKEIGKYAVIGAGSVVTRSIPDYEIWAGNPAKKIGDVHH